MERFKLGDYEIKATFNRKKYGMYRWDIEVFDGNELIYAGYDCFLNHRKPELAAKQFIKEMEEWRDDEDEE